jgi:uncharacterized membrane protein YhiD involved in acid resistance
MSHLFTSPPFLALGVGVLLLFLTIFLFSRRWIGLSSAFILLLVTLAGAVVLNWSDQLKDQIKAQDQETFNHQFLQAIEEIKGEIELEKESIDELKTQVHEIAEQIDHEKQKVDTFIAETRRHFQQ